MGKEGCKNELHGGNIPRVSSFGLNQHPKKHLPSLLFPLEGQQLLGSSPLCLSLAVCILGNHQGTFKKKKKLQKSR